ncbi:Mitochondrial outer membrane protein iml2 [Maudiozyma exigua]|uniref:Mitochondrial outer membrane protein iml2 n=1 Tax=Maudiozyma exigua TaxID=34358 RepID=A0A9P7B9G5_MAUEX|nr:Mitochondrial outer membrane protein iml2 [Kazachstania exigua]
MFRVLNRFKSSKQESPEEIEKRKRDDTLKILNQVVDFEVALQAMDYVLDDRMEQGITLLDKSDKDNGSPHTISVLARGVVEFLQATLSFEQEEMKKATETLMRAEDLSWKSKTEAEKKNFKCSSLYPPGTVYAVTYTESLLLHALLMLFSESLVEAAKALFKLRKAYSMLTQIINLVQNSEKRKRPSSHNIKPMTPADNSSTTTASSKSSSRSRSSSNSNPSTKNSHKNSRSPSVSVSDSGISTGTSSTLSTSVDIPYKVSETQKNDNSLNELAEKIQKMKIGRLAGSHIDNAPAFSRLREGLGLGTMKTIDKKNSNATTESYLSEEYDLHQATIDEFIASGTNLCYGILQVVLSLIPPAVGAVLSVVGFKGSREEGLRLIWKATRQRNVHGCIGLLALMFYYDGPFQFTDDDFDIPASGKSTDDNELPLTRSYTNPSDFNSMSNDKLLHPGKLLEDSLLQARALFPHSALWLLNEARMLSARGRLDDAMALMESIDVNDIHMRQVKVLMVFDKANTMVNIHDFERAAEELIFLTGFSDWSHAFYTYFAGCCYLEKWRMCELGLIESENSQIYKEHAEKLILAAPGLLSKKTFRSKNLPLDRFMARKVEQYKTVQSRLGCKFLVDAIATSPIHEIMYFYNGYNRMNKDGLVLTKRLLTEYKNDATELHDPDQELINNLLLAITLRRLNENDKGCKILDEKVLPQLFTLQNGKVKYIKKDNDPWAYPTAFYERALFAWKEGDIEKLPEIREWLVRGQNYADDYELSTRISMKVKAALDRVEEAL